MSKTVIESCVETPASSDDLRLMVRTMADVEAFEQTPLAERHLPDSTYAMLRERSIRQPGAAALHYFDSGDELDRASTITHGQLFERITQTANLLHSLGIGSTDVVGVIMPITPVSQYAIWGAEAGGIVCPGSCMLEPEIIAALLRQAGAKAVITYGPDGDIEAWHKAMQNQQAPPGVKPRIKGGGPGVPGRHLRLFFAPPPKFNGKNLGRGRIFPP